MSSNVIEIELTAGRLFFSSLLPQYLINAILGEALTVACIFIFLYSGLKLSKDCISSIYLILIQYYAYKSKRLITRTIKSSDVKRNKKSN